MTVVLFGPVLLGSSCRRKDTVLRSRPLHSSSVRRDLNFLVPLGLPDPSTQKWTLDLLLVTVERWDSSRTRRWRTRVLVTSPRRITRDEKEKV